MTFDEEYSLKYPVMADSAGFDYLAMGDHFLPWHDSFNHSFFAWEVLAAVAAKTKRIQVGPDVTVPIGGRYHPAIIAQAAATMERIFPGRFVLGLGSGEAMNEQRFLGFWPPWRERMDRLVEATQLIRRLWSETEYFNFHGNYFSMEQVMFQMRPKRPPQIFFSAFGPKAAFEAGRHADALMTSGTVERCRDVIFPAFEKGRKSASVVHPKQKTVVANVSTGPTDKIVARIRKLIAGASIAKNFDVTDPRKIQKSGERLTDREVLQTTLVFRRGDEVIDLIESYRKTGADQFVLSELSTDPKKAMEIYARDVIPYFRNA